MSLYHPSYTVDGKLKYSRQWWYEFTYAGKRIRESARTEKKTIAALAEKRRREEIERAYAGVPSPSAQSRIRTVTAALADYRQKYAANHRPKAITTVEERAVPLARHLGTLLAPDLTEDHIVRYMTARKKEGAGPRTVNIELGILARAMNSKWGIMWPTMRHLEEPKDIGHALSPEEEQRILDKAAKNKSRMIGPVIRIALMTGMRRDEIRLLRWNQINFEGREITVGKAKSRAGKGRVIPFGDILEATLTAYRRWYMTIFGPVDPQWYAFPLCDRVTPIDPTKPIGSFKTSWTSVRAAANVDCRFHDCRHTLCTKMAEAGVPEATMLAIMGHMSRAMLERYSHIRRQAKIDAMAAVEARSALLSLDFAERTTRIPTSEENKVTAIAGK